MKKLTPENFLAEYKSINKEDDFIKAFEAIDEQLEKFGLEVTVYDSEGTDIFWKIDRKPGTAVTIPTQPGERKKLDGPAAEEAERRRQERLGTKGATVKKIDNDVTSGKEKSKSGSSVGKLTMSDAKKRGGAYVKPVNDSRPL